MKYALLCLLLLQSVFLLHADTMTTVSTLSIDEFVLTATPRPNAFRYTMTLGNDDSRATLAIRNNQLTLEITGNAPFSQTWDIQWDGKSPITLSRQNGILAILVGKRSLNAPCPHTLRGPIRVSAEPFQPTQEQLRNAGDNIVFAIGSEPVFTRLVISSPQKN